MISYILSLLYIHSCIYSSKLMKIMSLQQTISIKDNFWCLYKIDLLFIHICIYSIFRVKFYVFNNGMLCDLNNKRKLINEIFLVFTS
uniref:Uncharacterized protein n=1 Tax=Octopus bimaculoides TaxID=37653 RepID=A0A0L8HSV4_OCTBM